jgi:pimeloyl-ACP methyl ester carboxylesterase
MMTSRWTTIGSLSVHSRAWISPQLIGQPPIVLVHGLGVSSRYMVPTAERLSADYRVYAPDLPGFGRSPSPPRPRTIVEQARTLGDWLRESELSAPVLVGNSYGCQVIAELMMQRPNCARALVLSAPTIEPSRRSAWGESARLLSDAPLESPRLVPLVIRDYLLAGPRAILFTLGDALADRIEEKLPRVTIPTLIVRGTSDPIVSNDWVNFLAQGMPHGSVRLLEGAPHAVNFSAAAAFVGAIVSFICTDGRDE